MIEVEFLVDIYVKIDDGLIVISDFVDKVDFKIFGMYIVIL